MILKRPCLPGEAETILVVAPHADDETLGAGGTIARLVAEDRTVIVAVMTGRGKSPHPIFGDEAFARVQGEFRSAMGVLGVERFIFADLPTTLLSDIPLHQINRAAADIVASTRPDVVLLPFEHDLHKDHGILNYAFRVALRPHLESNRKPHAVLAYEVPTETHLQSPHLHPSFEPHLWIDITSYLASKRAALACFDSQIVPPPGLRSLEAVEALATWRGAQIGVSAAEAFMVLRAVL